MIPFDSKMLHQLNKSIPTTSLDVIETAYCGDVQRFGLDEYEAMGYSYLSFSSEMFYQLDQYSGSVIINGSLDIEDANRTEYQINIGSVLSWVEEMSEQMSNGSMSEDLFITPELSFLEVRSQDKGYHLRKAEFCAAEENAKTDYYSGHLTQIESILTGVGMAVPEEFKPLYIESIQPDSLVSFQIQPKVSFELKNIMMYDYSQLVESSGMKISVNDKPFNLMAADWSRDKFNKILQYSNVKQAEEARNKPQYEIITVYQSFQKVPVTSLAKYIDYRVKIVRDDNERYEGKIKRISSDRVWLEIHSKEGDVTLPFNKSSIVEVDVYKESSRD